MPKIRFCKKRYPTYVRCSAAIDFNNGKLGICKVAEELGLEVGSLTMNRALDADRERILNIKRKSTCKVDKGRKNQGQLRRSMRTKKRKKKEKIPMPQDHFNAVNSWFSLR